MLPTTPKTILGTTEIIKQADMQSQIRHPQMISIGVNKGHRPPRARRKYLYPALAGNYFFQRIFKLPGQLVYLVYTLSVCC